MPKWHKVAPVAGAGLSALVLAAVGLGSAAPGALAGSGSTFTMAYQSDVPTLSPINGGGYESSQASAGLYDGLVTYAPSLAPKLVPDLATSWRVEDGGKVYVFTLRKGVRYSNGDVFKAQDVIYNIEQQLNPHNASWAESFYQGIQGALAYSQGKAKTISGMQVTGPNTLKITLTQPEGYFLNIMAMPTSYIADPAVEQKWGKAYQDHAVGTGPYKLVSWAHNSSLLETVNPYYWGPKPKIQNIKFLLGPSPTTTYEMFQKGQVDALSPVPSNLVVPTLRNPVLAKEFHTVADTGSIEFYFMDVHFGPFKSVLVRQALNLAVNRKRLVQLQAGQATPANQYLPPGYPGYQPNLPQIPFNPAQAKRLLAKAGYKNGFSITLSVNNDPSIVQRAESVVQNLAAIGVKVQLDTMSLSAYDTALSEGKVTFGVEDWGMDYPDPQDLFQSSLTGTPQTGNNSYWNDPAFVALVNRADAMPPSQDAARMKLYDQAQAIALEQQPWIPLFYPNTTILIANSLSPSASNSANLGYYLNPVLPISVQDLAIK